MESHAPHQQVGSWKKKLYVALGAVLGLTGFALSIVGFSKFVWPWASVTYARALHSVGDKFVDLQRAHTENAKLRLENLELRSEIQSHKFDDDEQTAKSRTEEISAELKVEAGDPVARTLASIDYRPPTSLPPNQMLALAAHYFQNEDFERSAAILHRLISRQDRDFRNPRNLLMTAICWYELDHLNYSNQVLNELLKHPENRENLPYLAQGRLWKALTERKLKNQAESQRWLTELLDHHPRSIEAGWVNAREGKNARHPSSHH